MLTYGSVREAGAMPAQRETRGDPMDVVDLVIGLTLMNAMPHLVLGTWKERMLSAFGFGDRKNIVYGVLQFVVSLGLFLAKYGLNGLTTNGIYLGALIILVIYLLTGRFWYARFQERATGPGK
jgi:hypothetical protein